MDGQPSPIRAEEHVNSNTQNKDSCQEEEKNTMNFPNSASFPLSGDKTEELSSPELFGIASNKVDRVFPAYIDLPQASSNVRIKVEGENQILKIKKRKVYKRKNGKRLLAFIMKEFIDDYGDIVHVETIKVTPKHVEPNLNIGGQKLGNEKGVNIKSSLSHFIEKRHVLHQNDTLSAPSKVFYSEKETKTEQKTGYLGDKSYNQKNSANLDNGERQRKACDCSCGKSPCSHIFKKHLENHASKTEAVEHKKIEKKACKRKKETLNMKGVTQTKKKRETIKTCHSLLPKKLEGKLVVTDTRLEDIFISKANKLIEPGMKEPEIDKSKLREVYFIVPPQEELAMKSVKIAKVGKKTKLPAQSIQAQSIQAQSKQAQSKSGVNMKLIVELSLMK